MESLGAALPRAYITGLVAAPAIVRQLRSPALRRAVRIESAAAFQLELAPLIVAFVAEQQQQQRTAAVWHAANLRQLRERSRALPAICDMIGDSTTLYARCVEWLLHLYADNRFGSDPAIRAALTERLEGTAAATIELPNGDSLAAIDPALCAELLALRASPVALCALRFDLLMTLHDRQVFRVAAADGAHSAAWLIDSCFRDGRFHADLLARLQQCLKPVDAAAASKAAATAVQQHKIIVADGASTAAHLAMVCANPSVRAQLLASIAQCLDECALSSASSSASSSSSSSDCTQHASLRALSDLLSLSSTAAEVVRQRGAGGFPQTSSDLVHVFYPAVVAWLCVDVSAAASPSGATGAEPAPPPAALAQIFAADLTCREVCGVGGAPLPPYFVHDFGF